MSAMSAINNRSFNVGGYKLASPIKLSKSLLDEHEIEILQQVTDYDDFGLYVDFRSSVGLMSDIMEEVGLSYYETSQLVLEMIKDRFNEVGIPAEALQDIRFVDNDMGSWVELKCRFFLEPKKFLSIDPNIAKIVNFYLDELCAEAKLVDVLNAKLPADSAWDPDDTDDEKINHFAWYLRTALPWEAQWLLNYSFVVDYLVRGDEVAFQYQPTFADEFSYRSDYDIDTAGLLIFEYAVYPAVP